MAAINDDVYFMVDKYDQEAVNLIKEAFGECEAVEEESFAGVLNRNISTLSNRKLY